MSAFGMDEDIPGTIRVDLGLFAQDLCASRAKLGDCHIQVTHGQADVMKAFPALFEKTSYAVAGTQGTQKLDHALSGREKGDLNAF